jgi:hypothetical protein
MKSSFEEPILTRCALLDFLDDQSTFLVSAEQLVVVKAAGPKAFRQLDQQAGCVAKTVQTAT